MKQYSDCWYADAVIYHMYTLSVSGAPFSNDYSLPEHRLCEIEKWIPHIKGMGFNAVLFSPVLKAGSHGYDVADYFEIDNRLGTNDEFRSLAGKMHDNGIRVILDCVYNHCGRDFFAFRELRNNNRNYANWFSGVDFSRQSPLGDPFNYDTWNGHYRLPKFNLHNAETKNYLLDSARFLIDSFGIDGMRLDAADVLDSNFMSELRRLTETIKPDFWLMGEVVHGDYSKWVNDSMLHSVTNYILYQSLHSSHNDNNLYELAYCIRNSVPLNGLPLHTFLDNHDQPRIASIAANPEHLNTLYALLFTLPGIPSVYYGSEWGIKGVIENGSDRALRPYIDIENRYAYDAPLTGHINRLICLRKNEKALKYGRYREVFMEYSRPFIFERSFEDDSIFVAVNIAGCDDAIDLGASGKSGFRDLLSEEPVHNARNIPMKPYSVKILKAG